MFTTNKKIFLAVGAAITLVILAGLAGLYLRKDKSTLLPDIKNGESISKSEVRNKQITKLEDNLPYKEPAFHYTITYYEKSKDIEISINATNLNDYRSRKKAAEEKLKEFGSDNLCYLLILWVPPMNIKATLTREDLVTSGCQF